MRLRPWLLASFGRHSGAMPHDGAPPPAGAARRRRPPRAATRAAALIASAALWTIGAGGPARAQAEPGPRPAGEASPQAELFAFAKASPLRVYDTPAEAVGGRLQAFEFGRAYPVREGGGGLMQIRLDDGHLVYVRESQVQVASRPRLLRSTLGYNRAERNRLQFWESVTKLTEFLSGARTVQAQHDFEEALPGATPFGLVLPVIQADTVEVLEGVRQLRILAVLLPVARRPYDAFERARKSLQKTVDVHCLVDVSGSTQGFLAPVMGELARGLGRDRLRDRIGTITLTTFGAGRHEASAFRGAMSARALAETVWHPPGLDQTTAGEREPLVDGLMTMSRGIGAGRSDASVLVVVSGADVEVAAPAGAAGGRTSVDEIALDASDAIFAQVTPEPGGDLLQASRRLRSVASVRYLDYSGTLGGEILDAVLRASEGTKTEAARREAFAPVVEAWGKERMLALLPRVLAPNATLTRRPAYAAEAEWFAVQLWMPENADLFRETVP